MAQGHARTMHIMWKEEKGPSVLEGGRWIHVLFLCLIFEVYGPLGFPSFWGHMLRMVAELMVLLRVYLGRRIDIQVDRTFHIHPSVFRAMAKRTAVELDRDRSPRGRSGGPTRGQSMPADLSTPSFSRPAVDHSTSIQLEGQITELTKGLQMMGSQLQTLATMVESQQHAFQKTHDP